ncbi:MAG: nuclear transport factor 2 family protein [Alphaproteobacteria bacterium]|nr:nuclear transport factor 2 family protein [Alphaproteobacteria bacterium]
MDSSSDVSACAKLAKDYFDALYTGDTGLFARIFPPDAMLWCVAAYLAIVAGREAPAARGDRREEAIMALSIPTPTTAHLRVRELFLPKRFTDDLTLLKQDGAWRIVAKVWDFEMVA